MTLGYICEGLVGRTEPAGYTDIVNTVIPTAVPLLFNFNFPIFDEQYRNVLLTKIIKHYYTREIGEETLGLFKLRLDTRLNEIMPYYNKMYEAETYKFNPIYDVDLTRQHKANKTGTQKLDGKVMTKEDGQTITAVDNTTKSDGDVNQTVTRAGTDKYSETPQGGLTGLANDEYLSNARMTADTDTTTAKTGDTTMLNGNTDTTTDNTTNVTTNNNTTINNIEDYIETVTGKQGTQSYSSMIMEYRESLINIDMMIINDLSDLFLGIWEVGYPW
jgi:hypothetical protein